jgi:hypothetical protein
LGEISPFPITSCFENNRYHQGNISQFLILSDAISDCVVSVGVSGRVSESYIGLHVFFDTLLLSKSNRCQHFTICLPKAFMVKAKKFVGLLRIPKNG